MTAPIPENVRFVAVLALAALVGCGPIMPCQQGVMYCPGDTPQGYIPTSDNINAEATLDVAYLSTTVAPIVAVVQSYPVKKPCHWPLLTPAAFPIFPNDEPKAMGGDIQCPGGTEMYVSVAVGDAQSQICSVNVDWSPKEGVTYTWRQKGAKTLCQLDVVEGKAELIYQLLP